MLLILPTSIVQGMFKVPPEDLLTYNLYRGDFRRDAVASLLTYLRPANVRVLLVSQTHTATVPDFDEKVIQEKWFGVKYVKQFISEETLAKWKSVAHVHQDLQLPVQNPFIPRDFELVPESEFAGDVQVETHPFGKVWYKPDRVFRTPRASIAFLIQLPSIMKSAENLVLTELFVKLVRDALNEYAYHASVAELMYSLRVKETGLELLFGGFSNKLGLLVELVTAKLFTPVFDAQRFYLIKQDLVREYKNALIKPAHKAKYLRLQLLERQGFRREESITAAEAATLEQLTVFVANSLWKSGAFLATFAHGNIVSTTANELQRVVEEGLGRVASSPMLAESPNDWPARHIHHLPVQPSGLLLEAKSEHAEDKNTLVEYYFQFGEHDVRMLAYADLLHQLMEEPLFDTLRTKQELGYDVSCTVRLTHGVIGYGITVKSSLFKTSYIRTCIDRFLVEFEHAIASMPEEHFQDHIQAQILHKLEPDHSLLEMTQRYWYEISSGRLIFDINERLASELELCTKLELLTYYREAILRSPKKLIVQIIGQASPDVTGDKKHKAAQPRKTSQRKSKHSPVFSDPTLVGDLYALKNELPFFPDHFQLQRDDKPTTQGDDGRINL
jgi:nardilysin